MLRVSNLPKIPARFKYHEDPAYKFDFIKHPYGNPPLKTVGMWKIDHAYDFGPEQLDYEDHSMHMLHQRPGHWRSFGVVVLLTASVSILYFVWLEFPFPGIMFGQTYMNPRMNAIKYVNYNEDYHNWDKLLSEYEKSIAEPEEAEEEAEAEEESPSEEAAEEDLEEVQAEGEPEEVQAEGELEDVQAEE